MALVTRLSRLFRADLNAVLDRLEEPEMLLRQAVREMEEEVDREEMQTRSIALELQQIVQRRADLEQRLRQLDEELTLCFDAGNEALARVLLKRRLEAERFVSFLACKAEERQATAGELATRTDEHRLRLEGMRQKLELLAGQPRGEACATGWSEPELTRQFAVGEDDVELALLREKQKRVQS
jgi:phage shock protein A